MGNLALCLPVTLKFEGGWSDNPRDPGGATMDGITLATFRRYRPGAKKEDLRAISPEVRQVIYNDGYWRPIAGDTLAAGVDLAAFDYAVNSGAGAAKKALAATAPQASVDRVKAICSRRLSLLHGLSDWSYWGKGWGSRVAKVEAIGIRWAAGAPEAAKAELQKAAAEAQAKANRHVGFATVAAASSSASTHSHSLGVILAAALAACVIGGVFVFLAWRHQQRVAALSEAAKGA